MPGFDLIIFDCDGVLVDSEIISAQVGSGLLAEVGYEITPEEIAARFAGLTWKDILLEIERESDIPFQATLLEKSERMTDRRLARDLLGIDGVLRAVAQLPGKRCICSNSSSRRLEMMLKKTGLAPLFGEHVFSAADTQDVAPKPAPDIFRHAAKMMQTAPGSTLVIEDSVHGVTGARAAGMRVLGFTGASHSYAGHADQLTEAGAETVISRMADLPATVAALCEWSDGI
ncbi:HAD family hydrolase [Pseudohoeflea coraliihabitans]|uniref:HAD family phosphatase n=1 Tax=Pseudohoeflea coraliihabitans TaxID=2860393 RepID=A0ABS6WLT0_9HYPH|nr:HAD family phosphatase [Pseudohoeflea sp. DP4N28-3]MBW3096919.1 HAD family phosphatase [Pseudohoeflea sp. DP4N28-3]